MIPYFSDVHFVLLSGVDGLAGSEDGFIMQPFGVIESCQSFSHGQHELGSV